MADALAALESGVDERRVLRSFSARRKLAIKVRGRDNRVTVQQAYDGSTARLVSVDVSERLDHLAELIRRELASVSNDERHGELQALANEVATERDPGRLRAALERLEQLSGALAVGAAGNGVWEAVKSGAGELLRLL